MPATANDASDPLANNTPTIAVDPTDDRFVAMGHRVDGRDFSCGLLLSGDSGATFVPADPVPVLPEGAEKCYAPEVEFDRRGALYFVFLGLHGSGNTPMGVYLVRSTDRGQTFSAPIRILGPNNFSVRLAIDRSSGRAGRLHIAWLAANRSPGVNSLPTPPNPIMASYSDDGGVTFSQPIQVSDPGRDLVIAPSLALGPKGHLAVGYYDLGNDQRDYFGLEGPTWTEPWSLIVAESVDGGKSFKRGVVVDDRLLPEERTLLVFTAPPPSLAITSSSVVLAVWHDARNGDSDVFISRKVGEVWEPTKHVKAGLDSVPHSQYQPRIAVAPNGRIDVVFYDRRNDPENRRNDVYYASSRDAGRTFTPSIRITSRSSDSQVGPRYVGSPPGVVEFGSRTAVASRDGSVIAAWTDTRVAPIRGYQDVYTAIVTIESGA